MLFPTNFLLFALVTLALTISDNDFSSSQNELTTGSGHISTMLDQVMDIEKRGKHKTTSVKAKNKKKTKTSKGKNKKKASNKAAVIDDDVLQEAGTTTITNTNGVAYKIKWHPVSTSTATGGKDKGLARYFGLFRTKGIALD